VDLRNLDDKFRLDTILILICASFVAFGLRLLVQGLDVWIEQTLTLDPVIWWIISPESWTDYKMFVPVPISEIDRRLPFQPTWWPVARSILLALLPNTIIVCVRSNLLLPPYKWFPGEAACSNTHSPSGWLIVLYFPLLCCQWMPFYLSPCQQPLGCFSRHLKR